MKERKTSTFFTYSKEKDENGRTIGTMHIFNGKGYDKTPVTKMDSVKDKQSIGKLNKTLKNKFREAKRKALVSGTVAAGINLGPRPAASRNR